MSTTCLADGCTRPVQAKGLCTKHYARMKRLGDPNAPVRGPRGVCSVDGCVSPHSARGYCPRHYRKWQMYGDPLGTKARRYGRPPVCSVAGCERLHSSNGLCDGHAQRLRRHGDVRADQPLGARKERVNAPGGYIYVWAPGHTTANSTGYAMEHRYVMSEHLGRPLERDETVHHKNGIRTNNTLENLELWVSNHPAGQRPEDIVPWAREMLRRYAERDTATPIS